MDWTASRNRPFFPYFWPVGSWLASFCLMYVFDQPNVTMVWALWTVNVNCFPGCKKKLLIQLKLITYLGKTGCKIIKIRTFSNTI